MMGDIYSQAASVVVWLGPSKDDSDWAMDYMNSVGIVVQVNFSHSPVTMVPLCKHGVDLADRYQPLGLTMWDSSLLRAIYDLLQRQWFRRLWIRQEIFLAKQNHAVVQCGPDSMPWSVFRSALHLIRVKGKPNPRGIRSWIPLLQSLHGFIYQESDCSIMRLRLFFESTQCSDPRDRIYAVTSLLRQKDRRFWPAPNYTKSSIEIYSAVVHRCLAADLPANTLTILAQCELRCHQKHPWRGPSWVPDWSTKVGQSNIVKNQASSRLAQWHAFPEPGILRVLGVSKLSVMRTRSIPKLTNMDVLDMMSTLRPSMTKDCENIGYPSGGTLLQALAKMLVGGAFAEAWWPLRSDLPEIKAMEEMVAQLSQGARFLRKSPSRHSLVQAVPLYASWTSEKTVLELSLGYVGIGPASAQAGDEVCVIVGCDSPMVLRKQKEPPHRYVVVGPCYVEGLMYGEALLGSLPPGVYPVHQWHSTGAEVIGYESSKAPASASASSLFDPRLTRFPVDLDGFRGRLLDDAEVGLYVPPDDLKKYIPGLKDTDLV